MNREDYEKPTIAGTGKTGRTVLVYQTNDGTQYSMSEIVEAVHILKEQNKLLESRIKKLEYVNSF
jgi:hypothetical protein